MRAVSVAVAKGRRKANSHFKPAEGSHVRADYDLLMANKGCAVRLSTARGTTNIGKLIDFYGLDIRRVGKSQYVLIGEWFDHTYVDYLADQQEG